MADRTDVLKKILKQLYREKRPLSQSEIQKRLNISKSYLSELLKYLEEKNKIIRTKGEGKTKKVMLKRNYETSRSFNIGVLKSTEYIPVTVWLEKISGEIELKVHFYNSTDRMFMHMDSGLLQAVCAPLVTLITNFIVRRNFRIAFGLGYGGSYIFANEKSKNKGLLTSENSSMSLLSGRSFAKDVFPKISFSNPATGLKKFMDGDATYISIWEPYASYLRQRSYSAVTDYKSVMGEQTCCALAFSERAIHNSLPNIANSASAEYPPHRSTDYEAIISKFSKSLKIEKSIIEDSLNFYTFRKIEIDISAVAATGFNVTEDLMRDMISGYLRGKRTQP